MSDERLNTAIDEVARRMTEGSPAGEAGFRRRVLARIEAGDAPRARWRPLFVAVPLAAAIVIAVVVTRSGPRPSGPDVPVAAPIAAGPTGPAPQRAEAGHETGPTPHLLAAGDRQAVRPPRPFESGVSAAAPHLDPIDPIDTIAVAPLGVDSLTPDPISVEPLETIAPLAVAPLEAIEEPRRNE